MCMYVNYNNKVYLNARLNYNWNSLSVNTLYIIKSIQSKCEINTIQKRFRAFGGRKRIQIQMRPDEFYFILIYFR